MEYIANNLPWVCKEILLTQGIITPNSYSSWETRYDNICVFWDRLGSLDRYRSYVFQTLFESSAQEFWIKCFFSWDQSQNNWDIAYSHFFLPKWWSNQSMLRHWGLNRVLRKGSRICNLKVDGPWDSCHGKASGGAIVGSWHGERLMMLFWMKTSARSCGNMDKQHIRPESFFHLCFLHAPNELGFHLDFSIIL